jgi:D-3-phosphoglycerate dehydrogenase
LKLHTDAGETWVEGTVFEPGSPRLTQIDGVDIEAAVEGTLLVIHNEDQPGVIGEVGTILGRHGLNIASFALGRGEGGAFGVVNLDVGAEKNLTAAVEELRTVRAIRKVSVVRL